MTRETNMAVGTRNGAGHGHLPLAGDRKTIKTERKRYLRLLATSKSGTLLACATVLGVRSPAQDAFRLHRLEDPFLVVNAFIARHDEGSLGTTV